jgi:hypothetical protein
MCSTHIYCKGEIPMYLIYKQQNYDLTFSVQLPTRCAVVLQSIQSYYSLSNM